MEKEGTIKSFDGVKIYYRFFQGKNSHTLVFLHGVGANWTVWKKEIIFFQQKGYSTLAIDFRGHGQSDSPEEFEKYRLHYFAHDLNRVLSTEHLDQFTLIGHSLGGAVAIAYCKYHPHNRPKSMILVETASVYPFTHDRLLNLRPYVTNLMRFIVRHQPTQKKHLPHFKEEDLSEAGITRNLHIISHLLHITPLKAIINVLDNIEKYLFNYERSIEKTLKSLNLPVLIIAGSNDQIIPAKYSKHLNKLIRHSKFKLLRGAGHMVIIDNPDKVAHVMYDFLKEKR